MYYLSPHLDTTLVVQNVRHLANCQNQRKRGPLGNSQLPPAKRRISILVGEMYSSHGGSSIPSTTKGQNSIPSSSLDNSRIADIKQPLTSNPSTTQQRSIHKATTTPGPCSRSTTAAGGTSMCRVVSCVSTGSGP
jgi:hypothetical protein